MVFSKLVFGLVLFAWSGSLNFFWSGPPNVLFPRVNFFFFTFRLPCYQSCYFLLVFCLETKYFDFRHFILLFFVQLDMQLRAVAARGEEDYDWSASRARPLQSQKEGPCQEN